MYSDDTYRAKAAADFFRLEVPVGNPHHRYQHPTCVGERSSVQLWDRSSLPAVSTAVAVLLQKCGCSATAPQNHLYNVEGGSDVSYPALLARSPLPLLCWLLLLPWNIRNVHSSRGLAVSSKTRLSLVPSARGRNLNA